MLTFDRRIAMHKQTYRRFLFHISILGIALSLLTGFYDVFFGFLWESIHLFMELLEQILDNVVEHFLHTELHDTQMIVFYVLLVFGGFMIFFIWKLLVMIYRQASQILNNDWSEFKIGAADDWQHLSAREKLVGVGVFIGLNLLIFSLVYCCLF